MIAAVVLAVVSLVPTALAGAQDATAGMKVYEEQKCSLCHAIEGAGNKKFPLDGVGSRLGEADIREWIVDPKAAAEKHGSTGKPAMKAYPGLSPADLDALVAYVKSLTRK